MSLSATSQYSSLPVDVAGTNVKSMENKTAAEIQKEINWQGQRLAVMNQEVKSNPASGNSKIYLNPLISYGIAMTTLFVNYLNSLLAAKANAGSAAASAAQTLPANNTGTATPASAGTGKKLAWYWWLLIFLGIAGALLGIWFLFF